MEPEHTISRGGMAAPIRHTVAKTIPAQRPIPTYRRRPWVCCFCSSVTRGAGRLNSRVCLLNELHYDADGGHVCGTCAEVAKHDDDQLAIWIALRQGHMTRLRAALAARMAEALCRVG